MTSTVRPIPSLPQELVDNIVDHLYDDRQSLSNCTLISHAWLPASRHHFFSKISLKAPSLNTSGGPVILPQEKCRRLHALLVESPHLIPNIRELEICEGSPLHHPFPDVQCSTTWVTTERTLTSLFKMLTHVRRLDFAATSTFHWSLLPPTFLSAFHTFLSRPSLQYLRLHSWLFPNFYSLSVMLSHSPNLKALALSLTTICNEPIPDHAFKYPITPPASDDGNSPSGSPRIRKLDEERLQNDDSLDITGSITKTDSHFTPAPITKTTTLEVLTLDFVNFACLETWLLENRTLFDITTLRELRVAHFHDAGVIEKLLRTIGGSLEHLHLKPGSWKVREFDLTHNPNLRSLRLTLDDPATAMPWATHLLSCLVTAQRRALYMGSSRSSSSCSSPTPTALSISYSGSSSSSSASSASSYTHSTPSSSSSHTTSFTDPELVSLALPGSSLQNVGLEFYTDPKKIDGWEMLDSVIFSPEFSALKYVEVGLFAIPNGFEWLRVQSEMSNLITEGELALPGDRDGGENEEGGERALDGYAEDRESGVERRRKLNVRWYQLGVKSQRSSWRLTPRISSFERGL
ncbi:hypothetical protein BJ165DRAFT_1458567 [Panaeolus papilionaceus]|nr:hypothetical protein BJ165DRAFT_1458567 [Panaeolus papilionaceus]